jgi:hypothetical protein
LALDVINAVSFPLCHVHVIIGFQDQRIRAFFGFVIEQDKPKTGRHGDVSGPVRNIFGIDVDSYSPLSIIPFGCLLQAERIGASSGIRPRVTFILDIWVVGAIITGLLELLTCPKS